MLPLLSNCALLSPKPREVEIKTVAVERAPLDLPDSDPINLETFKWIVITDKNQAEVWSQLEKDGLDKVLFGLSDKAYETLAVNNAKLLELVKQQKKVIDSYKRYYEPKKEN